MKKKRYKEIVENRIREKKQQIEIIALNMNIIIIMNLYSTFLI